MIHPYTFHDVTPGASFDHPVVDSRAVQGAIAEALRWGRSAGLAQAPVAGRYDAEGLVGTIDLLDAYARHCDSRLLDRMAELNQRPSPQVLDLARRSDALPIGAGGFPRDFEFIRTQMFEEKRQPLTSMDLFALDTSVPLGAKKHTARRALGSGEAQIHDGRSSEIPRARTTYAEEQFGVAYVVCAVDVNIFEAFTTDWAGLRQYQLDLRHAYRLVEERLNRIAWFGDVGTQLYGVTNYPSMHVKVLSTAFNDAAVSEDVMTALTDLANAPIIQSGGVFSPTEMAVSPEIHRFLFSRKHSTTGGTDTTIGEYFLNGQRASGTGVQRIVMAPELAAVGPAGQDGILCYRKDPETLAQVLIQPPTALPVFQSSPFDQTTVIFAATGGMVAPDVGNCILGWASV